MVTKRWNEGWVKIPFLLRRRPRRRKRRFSSISCSFSRLVLVGPYGSLDFFLKITVSLLGYVQQWTLSSYVYWSSMWDELCARWYCFRNVSWISLHMSIMYNSDSSGSTLQVSTGFFLLCPKLAYLIVSLCVSIPRSDYHWGYFSSSRLGTTIQATVLIYTQISLDWLEWGGVLEVSPHN